MCMRLDFAVTGRTTSTHARIRASQACAIAVEQDKHRLLIQQCRMHFKMMKFSEALQAPMSDLGMSTTRQNCNVHPLLFAPAQPEGSPGVMRGSHLRRSKDDDVDELAELFEQFDEHLASADQ